MAGNTTNKNRHITSRLKAFLKERGWRPAELASELGLKGGQRVRVYGWINGQAAPSEEFRPQLAKLMNCAVTDLEGKRRAKALPPGLVKGGRGSSPGRKSRPGRSGFATGVPPSSPSLPSNGASEAATAAPKRGRPKSRGEPEVAYSRLPGGRARLSVAFEGEEPEAFRLLTLIRESSVTE